LHMDLELSIIILVAPCPSSIIKPSPTCWLFDRDSQLVIGVTPTKERAMDPFRLTSTLH
jgi:hypothetical protein